MKILSWGTDTITGKVRSENQDDFLNLSYVSGDKLLNLFFIFDGMGGHVGGKVASGLAKKAFDDRWTPEELKPIIDGGYSYRDYLDKSLGCAITEFNKYVKKDRNYSDMGTTAVGCLIVDNKRIIVANCGDSRLYHYNSVTYKLTQITNDHEDTHFGYLNNCIMASRSNFDRGAYFEFHEFWADKGDRLLICSDGLFLELDDLALKEVMSKDATPKTIAKELNTNVMLTDARDNSTATVVQF